MAKAKRISGKSLEGLLVQWGQLSAEAAATAAEYSRSEGINVARAISEKGFMNEISVAEAICNHLSFAFIDAEGYHTPAEISGLLPAEFQQQYEILVMDRFDSTIVVASSDVPNEEVLGEIKKQTGCDCQVFVTTASALKKRLSQLGSASTEATLSSSIKPEESEAPEAEAEEETYFDPNVLKMKEREPAANVEAADPPADDQVSQEADELFAELERDLERFAPLDDSPEDKAED